MAFNTYPNKQDTNLVKDFLFNQPDVHISKHEYEGTGVIDIDCDKLGVCIFG